MFGENYRTLQTLRNKYENLKKRSKQKFADEKTFLKKTGGGPSMNFHIDHIDQGIKEIVGIQMTGLVSEFDGDVLEDVDTNNGDTCEIDSPDLSHQLIYETMEEDSIDTVMASSYTQPQLPLPRGCQVASSSRDTSDETTEPLLLEHNYISTTAKSYSDWSKPTAGMLRKEKSSPLRSSSEKRARSNKENGASLKKSRNPLNSKLLEWSSIELAELQKAAFAEEQQLKLKHMQEKHDQMMRLQESESAMRMKFLKEEHDMNMSLRQ